MNEMGTINICCAGICCNEEKVIEVPDWTGDGDNEDQLFCEKCVIEKEFFDCQCPGCVGGFPDCGLGHSFMYGDRVNINELDFSIIGRGICPFRTNGTLSIIGGNMERIDLSETASKESSAAVVKSIKEYIEKYQKK
jgi:hypothetical protein